MNNFIAQVKTFEEHEILYMFLKHKTFYGIWLMLVSFMKGLMFLVFSIEVSKYNTEIEQRRAAYN